tara:strand:- start:93 stop:434 length:342 start_codon:yes stop_codon:yes gene_type:complete
MKTYILIKNDIIPETAEDIKVNSIYGIYQNKCKAFWECKIANLKIMEDKKSKNPKFLTTYVLKEINLETSEIITTYELKDRTNIVDINTNQNNKIPVFYNNINKTDYDNIILA